MELTLPPAVPPGWLSNISESKDSLSHIPSEMNSDQHSLRCPTSLPSGETTGENRKFTTKIVVFWPLALHFIGSFAISETLIYGLNGRQLYLDRRPQVKLADGTFEPDLLGQHNLLQRDVNTIFSISLMLLRWIAAAWAAPLCWRTVFLLGTGSGLRHTDIKWVTSYGVLPPAAHFRNTLNLLTGLVLIFTLVPYLSSPLITGSISWVPSSSTVDFPSLHTINITGLTQEPWPGTSPGTGADAAYTFDTHLVKNFIMAWSSNCNEYVFKRMVPSAS